MKKNEFNDLKQGFQEALDFIKHKPVPGTEVDTFTVKRRHSNQLRSNDYVMSAQQIKQLRLDLNLSQVDFATVLGVSPSSVKSWEQGQRVPNKSIFNLMKLIQDDHNRVKELVTSND